jgi:MFS family permease
MTSTLQIWHLYIINFLLSFMNAFQNPASYVATSLLVPKEHYVRASGLQALSNSIVTILAPAFGSALIAFEGLKIVLILDLVSFAVAFFVLLFFIKIPAIEHKTEAVKEPFIKSCLAGISFLREHSALLRIVLFFAFINFIAKMGGYGMMPAMILGRTGNDQTALGMVEAAVGTGALVGSVLVTLMKPARSRVKVIFFACGISFLIGDVGQSLTHTLPFWIAAGFASNVPLAVLNANLTAVMRTNVPIEMQGRVFSARDTIQYSTIPIGLFFGGILADYVFEPFMAAASPLQEALSLLFGARKGSGIALIFFIVGMIGFVTSFLCIKNLVYRTLDEKL